MHSSDKRENRVQFSDAQLGTKLNTEKAIETKRQDRIVLFAYATLLYAIASLFASLTILAGVIVYINTGATNILIFGSVSQVIFFVLWIAVTVYVMAKNA